MNTDERKAVLERILTMVIAAGGTADASDNPNCLIKIEFPHIDCTVFSGNTAESGLFMRWSADQKLSRKIFQHLLTGHIGRVESAMSYLTSERDLDVTLAPILRAIQTGAVFYDRRINNPISRDGKSSRPR